MGDIEEEAENIAKEKIIAEMERKRAESLELEKQAEAGEWLYQFSYNMDTFYCIVIHCNNFF